MAPAGAQAEQRSQRSRPVVAEREPPPRDPPKFQRRGRAPAPESAQGLFRFRDYRRGR